MKPTRGKVIERRWARIKILDAANKARLDPGLIAPFTMRTLQAAVFVCRQKGLVKPEVIEAAGFRVKRKADSDQSDQTKAEV